MKPSYFLMLALSLNILSPVAIAATITARTGVHDRYNRIVFDWPQKIDFDAQQNGNEVMLTFKGQKDAQIKAVGMGNLPFIRNFKTQQTPSGLTATFQIPDHSKVESFRLGSKLAFDVLTMDQGAPKFPASAAQPIKLAEAKKTEKPPEKAAEKPVEKTAEKIAETPQKVLTPPADMPQTLAQRLIEKPSEDALQTPTAPVAVTTPLTVTLDTGIKPIKLAVFKRGGNLWFVTDKMIKDVAPEVSGAQITLLGTLQRFDTPKGTAYSFPLQDSATTASVSREKNIWKVDLNPQQPRLLDDVSIATHADDTGQVIAIYSGEQASIVSLTDPVTGDKLWVVPMRTPEAHQETRRDFANLQFLPTVLGAIIVPLNETLQVAADNDTVTIGGADKVLGLSGQKDRALGAPELKKLPPFRLATSGNEEGNFTVQREKQETLIVAATDDTEKARLFMELARLYVRNGFGIESLGALRVAGSLTPALITEPDFIALHGMGSALSGHEDEAKRDLSDNRLQSQPAAKLWLGYVLAKNQKWGDARAAFADAGNTAAKLPEHLKNRMILAKAETQYETGNIAEVDRAMRDITVDDSFLPGEKAAFNYLSATTAIAAGHADEAVPLYQDLIKGPDQMYRTKAELDMVAIQVKNKEIDLKKAIETLEQLRFSWRGDRLETRIMRELGQYYIDNKQYMEGLTIWRQAAGIPFDSGDTDKLTQAMQDVFNGLYVKNGIKDMSPLRAAALFDRFRELTPPGDDGDMAALHLAERLASADLLDQADAMLSKQLKSQPDDPHAASFGAKIATWRLLNGDGAGALKILDETAGTDTMPEELSQRRLLLRARALADNNQTDEALSLLDALQTPEALSLRADVNWRQNRWPDAVTALQTLVLNYRDQGKTAPDGPMPPLILKMAIAMVLDDNKKGMELLVAQYSDFMGKTSRAQAFNLITKASRGSSLADIDTLTKQVGEVELFQKFLKGFGS